MTSSRICVILMNRIDKSVLPIDNARLDLSTGQVTIIGKHSSAISRVRYEPTSNLLLTASWDRTLKLWDPTLSSPRLLKTLQQSDKILAMDVSPPYPSSPLVKEQKRRVVLAMTSRQVVIYDLGDLRRRIDAVQGASDGSDEADGEQWEPEQKRESSLKYMIRDVRCNADGVGECEQLALVGTELLC